MKPGLILRWVIVTLALALPLVAQGDHGPQGGDPGHAAGGHAAHEVRSTLEMENDEFFIPQFSHLQPHPVIEPQISPDPFVNSWVAFFDVNLYQVFVVAGMAVLFLMVAGSFGGGGGASWLVRVFRGWCHWIRDEVVYNVMGEEEGAKWAPFFLYLFFFIAFMNLVGLVPGSVTATATMFVTGALAVVIFLTMVVGGMIQQGPIDFWKNLLPHGLPVALIPLMALVEVVGLLVKPFALMVRLFANMLAGHLLIYSFIGLIFVFAKMFDLSAVSWLTAVPVVGMAVFINIIEALVVLLQAYIFTYLSALFVQQSLHPEH
ncbi:MAG: F0F1 ATP synthase subunit A [Planctomycetota bacterium]